MSVLVGETEKRESSEREEKKTSFFKKILK